MDERQKNYLLEHCFQRNRSDQIAPHDWEVLESRNLPFSLDRFVFNYHHLGSIIATVYVLLTITLLYVMKNRQAIEMKKFAICWYGTLCVLNALTLTRIVPHILFTTQQKGFYISLCTDSTFVCDEVSAFWATLFPYLKVLELGDIFISALRKGRITLFVWTHHFLALIASWYMYPYYPPIALWYMATISLSHISIYAYLFLKEFDIRGSKVIPLSVELVTQFLGSVISTIGSYFSVNGKTCTLPFAFLFTVNAMWMVCIILCSVFSYDQYRRYWREKSRAEITKL